MREGIVRGLASLAAAARLRQVLPGLALAACMSVLPSAAAGSPGAAIAAAGAGSSAAAGPAPQRIISLLPSLTEMACDLGACSRLVGVDVYSNWPAEVVHVPRVGGIDDASVERILALKPDLILTAPSSRVVPRLRELGLPVLVIYPERLADVREAYLRLGQALGHPAPLDAWSRVEAGLQRAAASLPATLRGTSVYFEVDGESFAASESSFIGELMARAGLRNIVPGRLGPFPAINPEFVVRADPQVIMLSGHGGASISSRPGWAGLQAVRAQRVCRFDSRQGDVLVRPGPRLAQAVQILVDCVAGRGAFRRPAGVSAP